MLLTDRRDVFRRRGEWARRTVDRLRVPATVRDLVLERVARLAPEARQVLETSAVLAEPATVPILTAAGALSEDAAREGLAAALASGLLREAGPGRFVFQHVLALLAVYEAIPVSERRQLHGRAARSLEPVKPQPVMQLARHFREAREIESWAQYAEAAADVGPGIAAERDVELVWAGAGSSDELAAADVAGKVALARIPVPPDPQPNPASYAFNTAGQIRDAATALGAAGVLLYVDEPGAIAGPGDPRSELILELSIPWHEGVQLRELVEGGQARLVLHADRDPERIYRLREWHEDPSLPDPRREVDVDELIAVQNRYHSDSPDFTQRMFSGAFTPRESVTGGLTPSYWAPLEVTEHILPGDHLRWIRAATQLGPPGSFSGETLETRERFLPGDVREPETWFVSPMRTGAADVPHDTQYESLQCTFCRKADRFVPGLYYLDSDSRHRRRSLLLEGTSYRMFSGGEEIPNSGSSTSPWFELDPEPATHRLEMEGVQPGVPQVRTLAPRISTAWTFTSSRPSRNAEPGGYTCPFSAVEGGCAFQPLLQLDYQLGLDLLNRAPADASHTFTVEVAPHSRTAKHLVRPVTPSRFDLWYSTDGGATWDEARVRPHQGHSTFQVTVEHPPLAKTNGYVWLRADARDVAGNRVEQTIERAYGLR